MTSMFLKVTAALALLSASAAVLAANSCCSLECCLEMLACCF